MHILPQSFTSYPVRTFNFSAKPLIKKNPLTSGCLVFLPKSVNILKFQVGTRSAGLLIGTLPTEDVLIHPTTIDSGAAELKIVFTNLTPASILIDASFPVAEIIILPTLLARIIKEETLKYGI